MGKIDKLLLAITPLIIGYFILRGDNFDPESIRGKSVLVTGASSGIGEAVAYRYAQLGAKLVITARRGELLEKVAKKCKELGAGDVYTVTADVGNPEGVKKLVGEARSRLQKLDFFVLNHAVMEQVFLWSGSNSNLTSLRKFMDTNFFSYVELSSEMLPLLEKSSGHLAIVSSIFGKFTFGGATKYVASKHALQGFFGSLRHELHRSNKGVSVTLMVYGPVASQHALAIWERGNNVGMTAAAGDVEESADALVRGVSARKPEVFFPTSANIMVLLYRLFYTNYEAYINNASY